MPNKKINTGSGRFAELDGLRAVAVASVVLFHCEVSGVFNAGFFGVDVFFTISGFIITAILLKEYRKDGNFNFLNFYFRRLKRLTPPVLGLMSLAFLVTPIISPDAFKRLTADAPAALFYYSNWWQICDKQDYFDTTPHVLRHLWSLAVEEQFYILWPLIAYAVLKRGGAKATGWVALVLSLLSTVWMWHRYQLNIDSSDQNPIYLGTDTHAMGLLMGAALACFWNPWAQREENSFARLAWRLLALASLAGLGYMFVVMNMSHPALYRGSFLLVPILTGLVAYCTMTDSTFFVSWILRTRVVQWIGLRSYSIYLVHWLIFVWMRLLGYTDFSTWTVLVPGLLVVLVLSEMMYRCLETPFVHFEFKIPGAMPKVATFAVYLIVMGGLTWAMTPAETPGVLVTTIQTPTPGPAAQSPGSGAVVEATAQPAASTAPGESEDPSDARVRISGGNEIYALGDSVLLGASVHLSKTVPGIQIDAAVGRQASQGLKVVQQWRGKLNSASTVLVHLGTNGYINEGQFKELLKELGDCKVVVINVHAERRWTSPNNEIIDRVAREFANVQLIDWRLLSANRPDYFVKDGIHLTHRGILALASQIKVATGGNALPELAPDIMLADAGTRRLAHKVHAADAKASGRVISDTEGVVAPQAPEAPASLPVSAPAQPRDADQAPSDAAPQPGPALEKDQQAGK